MRVLLDSCVSGIAAEFMRQAGHDVTWAGDWPTDPGDDQILRRAADESRVLATIDKDFGELVIVQGMVHAGLIRLVGFRSREQGPALVRLLYGTCGRRDTHRGAVASARASTINPSAMIRAGQYLVLGGKARALMRGRLFVTLEDIEAVSATVLRHRIIPNSNAEGEGITVEQIIERILTLIARGKGRTAVLKAASADALEHSNVT